MIIKALLFKKVAAMATLSAMALADGAMTRHNNARGAREVNPFMRPFAGSPAAYAATQFDVLLSGILIFTRPESKITKAVVAETAASHSWGIATNLRFRPASPTVVCTRYGVHGADEACTFQAFGRRAH